MFANSLGSSGMAACLRPRLRQMGRATMAIRLACVVALCALTNNPGAMAESTPANAFGSTHTDSSPPAHARMSAFDCEFAAKRRLQLADLRFDPENECKIGALSTAVAAPTSISASILGNDTIYLRGSQRNVVFEVSQVGGYRMSKDSLGNKIIVILVRPRI